VLDCALLRVIAALFVFLGGFVVMVLEIIGERFLASQDPVKTAISSTRVHALLSLARAEE
jgi:hypothetical protein